MRNMFKGGILLREFFLRRGARGAFILILTLIMPMGQPPIVAGPIPPNQVGSIVGGLLVKDIIAQIEGSLQAIIEAAGKEARQTLMTAAQAAILAIQNLKVAYEDSMNKTFDQLTKQQQLAFTNISNIIVSLDNALKQNIKEVEKIAEHIDTAVQRLPFSKNDPRILGYTPVYHVNSKEDLKVSIVVEGSLIAAGSPQLRFGDKVYEQPGKTDFELRFIVPTIQFSSSSTGVATQTATLVVFKKTSRFFRRSRLNPVEYSLVFYSIPEQIGRFSVSVIRSVLGQERVHKRVPPDWFEVYSGDYDSRSASCEVNADAGWAIDTNTVSWHQHHIDNGHYHGIRNLSTAGFFVELSANAKEPHNKLIGLKTGRGHISGHVEFDEVREVRREETQMLVNDEALIWGKDSNMILPEDTKGFTVVLRTFTGEAPVFTSVGNHRFLRVDYDAPSRQLTLRPNPVAEALR